MRVSVSITDDPHSHTDTRSHPYHFRPNYKSNLAGALGGPSGGIRWWSGLLALTEILEIAVGQTATGPGAAELLDSRGITGEARRNFYLASHLILQEFKGHFSHTLSEYCSSLRISPFPSARGKNAAGA